MKKRALIGALFSLVVICIGLVGYRVLPERVVVREARLGAEAPSLSSGLTSAESRLLAFARTEREVLAHVPSPWSSYWRPSEMALDYAIAVAAAYAEVRRRLEASFGPLAQDIPEFSRAFRPLQVQFDFLSSAEQIELQKRRLAIQTRTAHARAAAPLEAAAGVDADARGPLYPSLEFLDPAAALEVELRESAEAELLRRSRADLTENEFRAAFVELASLRDAHDLQAHVAVRSALRALLGPQRFLRVQAARDPQHALLLRVGRGLGLSDDQIDAAYDVVEEAQSAMLEAAAVSDDRTALAERARAVALREHERLVGAIGADAADAVLAARSELEGRPVPIGAARRVD